MWKCDKCDECENGREVDRLENYLCIKD